MSSSARSHVSIRARRLWALFVVTSMLLSMVAPVSAAPPELKWKQVDVPIPVQESIVVDPQLAAAPDALLADQCLVDADGPNDPPGDGQKDLTRFCVDPLSSPLSISWNWDETSSNNTSDACALFDVDNDGMVNYALCNQFGSSGQGVGYPKWYTCSNQKPYNCDQAAWVPELPVGTSCSLAITATDPFSAGNLFPDDMTSSCVVPEANFGGAAGTLLDVCSYTSPSPSSDAGDCLVISVQKGNLRLVKDVSPDDESTVWNFAVTGATPFTESITGDGETLNHPVLAGDDYSITETGAPGTNLSNYDTTWACTKGGDDYGSGSGTIISGLSIANADVIVCKFTNALRTGTLTVNKVIVPSSDTGKFNLLIDGTVKATDVGNGGTTGAVSVLAGAHTVSETAGTGTNLDSYVTTIAGDCDAAGNVSVSPGDGKTCTITNTRKGVIVVEKQTNPDGVAGSFTFTGSAAGTISDNGQIIVSNLAPGTYTSTESSLAPDFVLESIVCDDGQSLTPSTVDLATKTATFKVDPGETVKCTFTNKSLPPDLSITKTSDAATVSAGDTVGFTITVNNAGPGEARGVMIADSLPGGLSWTIDAANTTATGCAITGSTLSCGPDAIAAAASVKVHVTAVSTANSCGTLTNTATATPTNGSGVTSDPATITVLCPNLTVSKTGNGPISAGDTAIFTIKVKNAGLGEAKGVTLTDTLPGGVTWALTPAVTGCSITGTTPQTLSCAWASLAADAEITIVVSGLTTFLNCGVLSNTVTVAAANEANTSDNSATASIDVECTAIEITKVADAAVVSAGQSIGFNIVVTNPGPVEPTA